eukprot:Gb_09825 [translate_table: standard]
MPYPHDTNAGLAFRFQAVHSHYSACPAAGSVLHDRFVISLLIMVLPPHRSVSNDSSDEEDESRFYAKVNVSHPPKNSSSATSDSEDEEQSKDHNSTGKKKAKSNRKEGVEENTKGKKNRVEAPEKKNKNSKKSDVTGRKSPVDIEELLAETYAKGFEPMQNSQIKEKSGSVHKGSDDETQAKKSRKRKLQEVSDTPSGKDSAKKSPHTWSLKDEVSFANTLLASTNGGEIDRAAFYERVKGVLDSHCNTSQLYDKMRRMKSKYQSIQAQLDEGNIKEDAFRFKTPHDATLFKIWKQIWGKNEENRASDDEETEQNPRDGEGLIKKPSKQTEGGHDASRRKEISEDRHEPEQEEQEDEEEDEDKEEEEESESEGRKTAVSQKTPGVVQQNGNIDVRSLLQTESMALINQLKTDVQNMLGDAQSKTAALIDSLCKQYSPPSLGFEPEVGIGCGLTKMKDLIYGLYSPKEFSRLDGTKSQALQQKWREQHIRELTVLSQRLELLQEECQMSLQQLETGDNHGRS